MWSVIQEKSTSMETWKKTLSKEKFSWVSNLSLSLNGEETFSRLRWEGGRERWRHFAMLDTLNASVMHRLREYTTKGRTDEDSGVLVNQLSGENKTLIMQQIVSLVWWKYSHCGQFHTNNMTSLITELGGVHPALLQLVWVNFSSLLTAEYSEGFVEWISI